MSEAWYATLAQARAEVKEIDPGVTSGDEYIRNALAHISARIDTIKSLTYAPLVRTRYLDSLGDHIDDLRNELVLPAPALEILSVTVGGASWAAGVDYLPSPRGETPITALRALSAPWSAYASDWIDSIAVRAVWGWRREYDSAWIDSLDTVRDSPLLAAAGVITVSSYTDNSPDGMGRRPRWSDGQLLRLVSGGQTEYALLLRAEPGKLTVWRGVRGTIPRDHLQDTRIEIFMPEAVIERATLRWVSYLYKRRGQFERVSFDGIRTTSFPPDMPEEVSNILAELPDFHTWRAV